MLLTTKLSKSFHSPHPLVVGVVTSGLATAASHFAPVDHAAEVVGLVFLTATYWGCLRAHHTPAPHHYGLELGGLLQPGRIDTRRVVRETLQAFLIGTGLLLLILPFFWLGFRLWYDVQVPFQAARVWKEYGASPLGAMFNLFTAHLFVVALPEEAFFRGYLQTSLDDRAPRSLHVLGLRLTLGLLLSSALFSLGHLSTAPQLGRLAVFFPSLLFGVVRDKTGGIGASVFLHAECNVLAAVLGRGYGLY